MSSQQALSTYLKQIKREYATGRATEHSYRGALKTLLGSVESGLTVINEPKRIEVGAPDFIVERDTVPIGFVEAKDVEVDLDHLDRRSQRQLDSYRAALPNLVLTNYLDFRWYVGGDEIDRAHLAEIQRRQISPFYDGFGDVHSILNRFAQTATLSISSPQVLSRKMAGMAREIAHLINRSLTGDDPSASLRTQMEAFEKTLIPNLSVQDFADMYAQTLAYGLFAARIGYDGPAGGFSWKNAFWNIPKTNPFLRKMFQEIAADMDDRVAWLVETLSALLAHADMDAILVDFGQSTRQEDPVVHFYETFLAAYNPKERERRGVYYTPEPVVSYIVRSVDHLLKDRFNRQTGLADTKTMILDPATGTGTFLYFVIQEIYEALEGQRGTWDAYVREHLLPRTFGFELLMAPYTVAHMKLGVELQEMGYKFQDEGRLGVYLTNTLEETARTSDVLFAQFIAEEAEAAEEIKRDKPIMVVLGNPPYSGHSANKDTWIDDMLRDYYKVDGKPLGERNSKWLQDDYVKFIRFGQWRINQTGEGVLAFVTNHGYLDNPTFRGMRQSLIQEFSEIYILDLHGNARKKETTPDGGPDENVFDIMQGVSIGVFVKRPGEKGVATVYHADLWGAREEKYDLLREQDVSLTQWTELQPDKPFYLFVPQNIDLRKEYQEGWSIIDIFPLNSMGVTTGNDSRFVAFDDDELKDLGDERFIAPVAYRPFDNRRLYYNPQVLARARTDLTQHLRNHPNLALNTLRRPRNDEVDNFFVTQEITDKCIISSLDNAQVFPLYLYPDPTKLLEGWDWPPGQGSRRPNLNPRLVQEMEEKLNLKFVTDGHGDFKTNFGPEDVFHYAYAIFHSLAYRERYAEFLCIDFPRLPLTSDVGLFKVLCERGAALVDLHLLHEVESTVTRYLMQGSHQVARGYPKHTEEGRVYINKDQYFEGVTAEVWGFQIGNYQVLEKWLKDRRGQKLSFADIQHYQKIVAALFETVRIMEEIDEAISEWPIR